MKQEIIFTEIYHDKVKNYQEFESIFIYFSAWNDYYEITYTFHFTDLNIFKEILDTHTHLINKYTLYEDNDDNEISSIGDIKSKDMIKIIIQSTEWNLYFNIWLLIHYDSEGDYNKRYRKKIII